MDETSTATFYTLIRPRNRTRGSPAVYGNSRAAPEHSTGPHHNHSDVYGWFKISPGTTYRPTTGKDEQLNEPCAAFPHPEVELRRVDSLPDHYCTRRH
ncbi:hypothetical protein E2C01_087324 [Portunus trituberculatus]|uniref:Uncharacterized protein n=1 Tax=Portunus trituberculatus TaxID=210409 RepID=A0A5B7JC67_PORTR|nr:hypothetical protein [Portunus trituberculatus]